METLELPPGSEVITPALTFGTTLAPLVQKGLVPVFADVEPGTYLIDLNQVESLITKKTRALMIPNLIGNIPDMKRLRAIAAKHDLWFIEDSCDVLGGTFAGKPAGHFSDISTTSFYASHIITAAGSGGMACFNDDRLAKRALVMSNWGRDSTLFGIYEQSEEIRKRFKGSLAGRRYDAKFIFSEIGYNFQATELNGAFGLEQLKRLPGFIAKRRKNFEQLRRFLTRYEEFFILPQSHPQAGPIWLAFPLTLRAGAGFTRYDITRFFEERNIQTRPIFTGNVLRQPAFRNIRKRVRRGGYPVADEVMWNSFLFACHQGLSARHLDHIKATFDGFLKDKRTRAKVL